MKGPTPKRPRDPHCLLTAGVFAGGAIRFDVERHDIHIARDFVGRSCQLCVPKRPCDRHAMALE
jgi:hypothetical protein